MDFGGLSSGRTYSNLCGDLYIKTPENVPIGQDEYHRFIE